MKIRGLTNAISLVLATLAGTAYGAEQFPNKPIHMYVGFAPGGSVASQAQMLAEVMRKRLSNPVVVMFKPGASQLLAAREVAKSAPDGYTVFFTISDLFTKLIADKDTANVTINDFVPIGATAYAPFVLAVSSKSQWQSVDELLAYCKKMPAKSVSYGSTGPFGNIHLAGELLAIRAGVNLNHIPFQGAGPADTALMGGHIDMTFGTVGRYLGTDKTASGLRVLAVLDTKRSPQFPNVPTMAEKGYDVVMSSWWFALAPKGMPEDVRASLVGAFGDSARDQTFVQWLTKGGFISRYLKPTEVSQHIESDYKLLEGVIKTVKANNQ